MASRVYFRFSSSTDFDYVTFDGAFITIGELKFLISKKTGVIKDRNTVIELFESRTGEEYVNAQTMVSKNASVVAKRSPAVRAPPISAVPSKAPQPESPTKTEVKEEEDDGLGPGAFAPETAEEADNAAISELVKGFHEVWKTDLSLQPWRQRRGAQRGGRRGPFRVGRPNLPPPGYICHRCNTPGHFIDECPTNGDPAYDFIRVRYPTGIPSSMLKKDNQGGLQLPSGDRAIMVPNIEKFLQEMEGVPCGEPIVKQLEGPENHRSDVLSSAVARHPVAVLMPLLMSQLPQGSNTDLQTAFFKGSPMDRTTFKQCYEAHERTKSVETPKNWMPPQLPSYEHPHWRHPSPDYYQDGLYGGYPPSAAYPSQWDPSLEQFYDQGYHPAPPPPPRFPEPSMHPQVPSMPGPSLSSEVVRLHGTPEEHPDGHRLVDGIPNIKALPYGFERSDVKGTVSHSPSRSRERSHRRRSDHRSPADRSLSPKRIKLHKKSREKTQHKRREKQSRKDTHKSLSPPLIDTLDQTHQDGLDRWKLEDGVHMSDIHNGDKQDAKHKHRSEKRLRSHSEKERRSRRSGQ